MINNKRGMSMIVSTLIIILLVLVAIGIVWVVVKNLIDAGTDQISYNSKCLDVDIKAKTVTNTSLTNYSVTLLRTGSGEDIAGIKLVFFNASDSTSSVKDISGNIEPLATVTKSIMGDIEMANKLEVTPYFQDDSGNEKLCSQTSSLEF